MEDRSEVQGGAYCVILNSDETDVDTYYLTNTQMEAAFLAGSISSNQMLQDDADNDVGFERFSCTYTG